MRNKNLLGILLISIALISILAPLASAETLVNTDFQQESFAKTVDYYDYARAYATLHGIPTPAGFDKWHANMYMTYINSSGIKLLYAGLENVTTDGTSYLRIPMQSFIMHYKTSTNRDVITSSTFLMLMAFNETATSLYADSPDRNDILYASFSLGFDLSALNAVRPSFNSKTEIIPLTHSDDNLQWTWGMKYTNLTALWWRTWIDPNDPHSDNSLPLALTTYDELTFTYKLTIDPAAGTATLQENHVIGRMRDLFIFAGILWVRYDSTGTYGMLGRKLSNETIYDYIQNNNLKMSIINFQTSILADHETYSATPAGQNVTATETQVTDTSINTYADDGEKIFNTDFATKQAYKLFNYTADPTESVSDTYNSVTRTASAAGFAGNAGLFAYHIGLMKFLPLVVVNMNPALFAKAAATVSNMSRANYFYITSYPQYSGYRIEHDPTFTAYAAISTSTSNPASVRGGAIVIAIIIIAVGIIIAVLIARRRIKPNPT